MHNFFLFLNIQTLIFLFPIGIILCIIYTFKSKAQQDPVLKAALIKKSKRCLFTPFLLFIIFFIAYIATDELQKIQKTKSKHGPVPYQELTVIETIATGSVPSYDPGKEYLKGRGTNKSKNYTVKDNYSLRSDSDKLFYTDSNKSLEVQGINEAKNEKLFRTYKILSGNNEEYLLVTYKGSVDFFPKDSLYLLNQDRAVLVEKFDTLMTKDNLNGPEKAIQCFEAYKSIYCFYVIPAASETPINSSLRGYNFTIYNLENGQLKEIFKQRSLASPRFGIINNEKGESYVYLGEDVYELKSNQFKLLDGIDDHKMNFEPRVSISYVNDHWFLVFDTDFRGESEVYTIKGSVANALPELNKLTSVIIYSSESKTYATGYKRVFGICGVERCHKRLYYEIVRKQK